MILEYLIMNIINRKHAREYMMSHLSFTGTTPQKANIITSPSNSLRVDVYRAIDSLYVF